RPCIAVPHPVSVLITECTTHKQAACQWCAEIFSRITEWQVVDPRLNGYGRERLDINSVTIADPVSLTKELVALTFWLETSQRSEVAVQTWMRPHADGNGHDGIIPRDASESWERHPADGMVGCSAAIREVLELVQRVAPTTSTVL